MARQEPVERIRIRLPAEPRLAPVVRVSVLYAGQTSGLAPSSTKRLAALVERRFRTRSRASARNRGSGGPMTFDIEIATSGIAVRIEPGGRRQAFQLSAHRPDAGRPRAVKPDSTTGSKRLRQPRRGRP